MTGWPTIDTAPRDGSEIVIWIGADFAPVASWQCLEGGDEFTGEGWIYAWCLKDESLSEYGDGWIYADSAQPTHWMPLPEGPKDE